jgi:hypothetical protein
MAPCDMHVTGTGSGAQKLPADGITACTRDIRHGAVLEPLSELSRGLARTQTVEELVVLTGECLRAVGLRGCVVGLEGDTLHVLAGPR